MKPTAFLLVLTLAVLPAAGQAPPSTDLYLMKAPRAQTNAYGASLINVTNRDGYDNQPVFLPDGRALLYTSIRDGQADIYRFELGTGRHTRLTQTAESEYSPTPLPGGDGFSVVRVEEDGTQRLWRFGIDGRDPALLLPRVRPVGYHAWADAETLVLFVLGEPPTLQRVDLATGRADTLAHDIGRSLQPVPGRHAVSFVHKETGDAWTIKMLDLDTGALTAIAPARPGREDHAWMPDGTLLTTDGPALYRWNPDDDAWQRLADFSSAGLKNLSRLAVSPDGAFLALVGER